MSEYTSTREGYQRSMELCLVGPPEGAKLYTESTALPTFYHIFNGERIEYDAYVKSLAEWRSKISDYEPKV